MATGFQDLRWAVFVGALGERAPQLSPDALLYAWTQSLDADRGGLELPGRIRSGEAPPPAAWGASVVQDTAGTWLVWRGDAGVIGAAWADPPEDLEARRAALLALEDDISRALRSAGTRVADERSAWARCNVPLLFLDARGAILDANPAAVRKLSLPEPPQLPSPIAARVQERLQVLDDEGLAPGASGDYSYLKVNSDDGLLRVGLAPVEDGPPDARWLLSVERGGMRLTERIELAEGRWGLTPREAEVLACLADGLSNRAIANVIEIAEPTVKFHLVSLMRKSKTGSRTELLAELYSLG